jgi:hypothetical protein
MVTVISVNPSARYNILPPKIVEGWQHFYSKSNKNKFYLAFSSIKHLGELFSF